MSHVAAGKGFINPDAFCEGGLDYEALKMALEMLGDKLEIVLGQKEYKWVGQWYNDYHAEDAAYKHGIDPKDYGKCEHVIRFKRTLEEEAAFTAAPQTRPNEIGLVRLPNGTLAPVFDFYGSRGAELRELVGGASCPELVKLVNQCKVVLQVAKNKGHTVKSIERLDNGKIKMKIGIQQGGKI